LRFLAFNVLVFPVLVIAVVVVLVVVLVVFTVVIVVGEGIVTFVVEDGKVVETLVNRIIKGYG